MKSIEYVQSKLTRPQLWGQLAEEAAELAQAALKMQRLEQGVNLPRMSSVSVERAVIEEHADVENCLLALGWEDEEDRRIIREIKMLRWTEALMKEETNE